MNPLSSAETENETVADGEAFERELFARRARALEPAVIPSLASVLRAADGAREKHAARGSHGRAVVAMLLAAACMVAALTKIPQASVPGSIVAEMDASPPATATVIEALPAGECTMSDEAVASEERACFAPTPLLTPAPPLTAAPAEHTCAEIDHGCAAEESCAYTTQ